MSATGPYTIQYEPKALKELTKLEKPAARRIVSPIAARSIAISDRGLRGAPVADLRIPQGIRLRRCRFRLAVAQVRLSGEQVVQGCLHGVVVQVGVVEREVRGVCQASRSGGEGDVQTLATCRRAGAFTQASAAS